MEGLLKFLKDDRGATMVEYALMIALIALVCIVAVTALGTSVSSKFSDGELTSALK
jgi:pilus assembly protein Flp/PilA